MEGLYRAWIQIARRLYFGACSVIWPEGIFDMDRCEHASICKYTSCGRQWLLIRPRLDERLPEAQGVSDWRPHSAPRAIRRAVLCAQNFETDIKFWHKSRKVRRNIDSSSHVAW